MAKKEKRKKAFSTCLEDASFAEMMQKMTDQQGVGSLCSEMMKKIREKQGAGGSFSCAEVMESLMKKDARPRQSPRTTNRKGGINHEHQ